MDDLPYSNEPYTTYEVERKETGAWDIINQSNNNTETVIDVYADRTPKCTCNNDDDHPCAHIVAAEMFEGER